MTNSDNISANSSPFHPTRFPARKSRSVSPVSKTRAADVFVKGKQVWGHFGTIVEDLTEWFLRVMNQEERPELGKWNIDVMVPSTLLLITGIKILESTVEGIRYIMNHVFKK